MNVRSLFAFLSVTLLFGWGDPIGVQAEERVRTAHDVALEMRAGFNIGNTFDYAANPRDFETQRRMIDAYYERGFRNVRIPVTWTEKLPGIRGRDTKSITNRRGRLRQNHSRLKTIVDVVDYALSKPGMYVVLNAHHEKQLKNESDSGKLEALWADLAELFKERDGRLIFEILNEPHRDFGGNNKPPMPVADLREMTGAAYRAIRAVSPTRIVVIGGNQWMAGAELAEVWTDLDPVGGGRDPYVMATIHHYSPWEFAGSDQGPPIDNWTKSQIEKPFVDVLDWSETIGAGVPIYVGEYGVGWGARGADRLQCNNVRLWYRTMMDNYLKPSGLPSAVWDDGAWFKVYSRVRNGFDSNLVECISGGACLWDEGGRFNTPCNR